MKPCTCEPHVERLARDLTMHERQPKFIAAPAGVKRDAQGRWIHQACDGYLACDFVYLDDNEHPATTEHCGYFTCEEHERIAVGNVGSRQW